MKILDEKGRLFGKLNIVDLLVLALVVVVAAVLAVKFLGGEQQVGTGEAPALTYTVRVMEVEKASYEAICQYVDAASGKKDQLMASGKLLNGYVVAVEASEHIHTAADTVGGDTLDLLFTVEAVPADALTGVIGSQEVRIGKEHILKTAHFEFENGVVITCAWQD